MKISVILAHPNKKSFNHAMAICVIDALNLSGHEVSFHDLYEEGFDPLLTSEELPKDGRLPPEIALHCSEISDAEGIVIIHPNWWGQPPAILKGWIDRVMRPGVAYEFLHGDTGEGVPHGLLKAKSALVFNTSNTETKREQEVFGDPLEAIWKDCIFKLCGVKNFHRKMFTIMVLSTENQRQEWLKEVRHTVNRYYPKRKSHEH